MLGALFVRQAATMPRQEKHFLGRVLFAGVMLVLIYTAWLLITGVQPMTSIGDMATFGSLVFRIAAPLQFVVILFVAALASTLAVAHEKDRRTLELLLMTSLSNTEIVLGKLSAGLLLTVNILLPLTVATMLLSLLGGVSLMQVCSLSWLVFSAAFFAASLGVTTALWREKTFQAIAASLLGVILGLGVLEAIPYLLGTSGERLRWLMALTSIVQPLSLHASSPTAGLVGWGAGLVLCGAGLGLLWLSIVFLRRWNPSRMARSTPVFEESLYADSQALSASKGDGQTWRGRPSRTVWSNPILWREMCTWAYGKRIILIRLGYFCLAALVAFGLSRLVQNGAGLDRSQLSADLIPPVVRWLAPFLIVSLSVTNALAVNSITNERDQQSLELLLVTELSPWSFLLGKALGVLYVVKEMVLIPILIFFGLWWAGCMTTENLIFTFLAWLVMNLFAVMLGIHCGMTYHQSRAAISTSLGTIFFLFIGVVLCMLVMISFHGAFERQLAPFLAIILGGGTLLYVALSYRTPSPALTLSAFGLPFLTFFAITSFLLRDQELTVFSTIVAAYGFTTIAMFVPAVSEFQFAVAGSSRERPLEE
jgi:ABC-type Na+ efflux pump permease subunit